MTEREEKVRAWLDDPITRDFLEILRVEARTAREMSLAAATGGDSAHAMTGAAHCGAYRWALSEGLQALMKEADTKEHIESGKDDSYPEDIPAERLADALSADSRRREPAHHRARVRQK